MNLAGDCFGERALDFFWLHLFRKAVQPKGFKEEDWVHFVNCKTCIPFPARSVM